MGNGMENSTVFSSPWENSNQIKMEILSILKPDRLILGSMHFNHNSVLCLSRNMPKIDENYGIL